MTGTIMERSHAPLAQWAVAFKLVATRGRSVSVREFHCALRCQYNTAWFIHRRIMEAIRRGFPELALIGLQARQAKRSWKAPRVKADREREAIC